MREHVGCLTGLVRWKFTAALVLLVVVGASEGLSLVLLVPLLRFVGVDLGADAMGRLERAVLGTLSWVGVPQSLGAVLILYVVAASLQVLLARYQAIFHIALEQEVVRRLRQRLCRAIFRARWLALARERSTDFAHVLTRELDRVGAATSQLLSTAATACVSLVYLAVALALSPVMTAMVLGAGLLLLVLLRRGSDRARSAGEEFSRASGGMYGAAIEYLGGIKTIKSQGREERAVALFSAVADRLAHAHVDAARAYSRTKAWFDAGAVWVLALALYVAIGVLGISAGPLLLLLFVFARMMPRLSAVQQNVQQYLTLAGSVENVSAVQARVESAAEHQEEEDLRPFPFVTDIGLHDVGFRYDDRAVWTLRHVTLALSPATTTAIVGPSGAGKSTLADLVMGLVDANEGMITVDGKPLERPRLRAWRDRIGYVAQDTFLLHDTVRANLLWAHPAATDEDIRRALRLAAADAFVAALPDGLDTTVGDRGVKLSGGERQRIALARALLRDPALLILDEATSSLDSENEQRILQAIDRLHGSMTIVVIAHRLSTIRGADMIHVLDQGRIIESGSWETLLSTTGGRFRQLCAAQDVAGAGIAASLAPVPPA